MRAKVNLDMLIMVCVSHDKMKAAEFGGFDQWSVLKL